MIILTLLNVKNLNICLFINFIYLKQKGLSYKNT